MADEERTPQAETLMPRYLPAAEGVRPGATTQLAFGIDTGEDAILGTRGCYVLYPGNTNGETIFVRHTEEEYRNKWPGPSVGAFPLCPSNNANQDAQRARLETHLSRLIRAIEESASYIEEAGFTSSLNGLAGSRSE